VELGFHGIGNSMEKHRNTGDLPSGKRLHNYGKSPFLMGKLTISMAMFNSKLLVYQSVMEFALG